MKIVIRPEAEADIKEATDWYEQQRPDLGQAYLGEIEAALAKMCAGPKRFPFQLGPLRRCKVLRFPFSIYFIVREEVLVVLHQRRDPKVWKSRMDR